MGLRWREKGGETMSTVGAFAAYGSLNAFAFSTNGGRARGGATVESGTVLGARNPANQAAPPPDAESSSLAAQREDPRFLPLNPVARGERGRVEIAFRGTRGPAVTGGIAVEDEAQTYDPRKSVEDLARRISEQVDRFEELLKQRSRVQSPEAVLRDPDGDNLDIFGRPIQADTGDESSGESSASAEPVATESLNVVL